MLRCAADHSTQIEVFFTSAEMRLSATVQIRKYRPLRLIPLTQSAFLFHSAPCPLVTIMEPCIKTLQTAD